MDPRPPVPPFTEETARQKVRAAEDAWNTCDPERVAGAYTPDSAWRNRDEFFQGREAIVDFLGRKWSKEVEYRLKKELWCFHENRISVRFARAATRQGSGGGATETSTGSSTSSATCAAATRASTTTRSTTPTGASTSTSGSGT
jgi:nuclear transport factor 2 (NTF2) superfamily protein